MNPAIAWATSVRVLRQLRRDHRTVALILVVPTLLVTLVWWMFLDQPADLRPRRRAAGRDLPAGLHVPGHLDHDAARAHLRHARAPHDHPARPARPAARLRRRLRPDGDRAGRPGVGRRGRPARPRRRRLGRAGRRAGGGQRPARDGARPLRERVRGHRVPGRPVHAGRRAPAAAAVRALPPPRGAGPAARAGLRGPADELRLRRPGPRRPLGRPGRRPGARRRGGARRGAARPGPRRGHHAPAHRPEVPGLARPRPRSWGAGRARRRA